jgi:hypothetical protein
MLQPVSTLEVALVEAHMARLKFEMGQVQLALLVQKYLLF